MQIKEAIKIMTPKRKMRNSIFVFFLGVFFISGLQSCDSNRVYEENLAMENNSWNKDDIKEFSFEVADTLSPLNIYINLRTTVDYPYSNIIVFMDSEYPNGVQNKDTLEFILAESDGKWNGENSGTIIEFRGMIASGGRFSSQGKYTFRLQHAMREDDLAEVVDIGMRVEIKEQE